MLYLHVTQGRAPVVTTAEQVQSYTTQALSLIDGLVGPFESADEAARWAEMNGATIATA